MFDVYLGGYANTEWREEFKSQIARDITIFDPYDKEYDTFDAEAKANHIAKELEHIEQSEIVVFYMCKHWNSLYSMMQLGEAIGRGKQIIACIAEETEEIEKIERYCEYRGIPIVNNVDDLVANVEECIGQAEMLKSMEL